MLNLSMNTNTLWFKHGVLEAVGEGGICDYVQIRTWANSMPLIPYHSGT